MRLLQRPRLVRGGDRRRSDRGAGGGRARALTAAVICGAALLGLAAAPHLPVLLWNATASAPLGFYALSPLRQAHVGDWVAYRPPGPLARWLAAGGYLPEHVPLLKQVAAAEGQEVCRVGELVEVDGRPAAEARRLDRRGRALPAWEGCARLQEGQVLLLNPDPDSLDSRYFGPARTADLIGRAAPLWIWGRDERRSAPEGEPRAARPDGDRGGAAAARPQAEGWAPRPEPCAARLLWAPGPRSLSGSSPSRTPSQ